MQTWIPCNFCGEWWCNLHQEHVHDCDCPPLEDMLPIDPYEDPPDTVAFRIDEIKKDPPE